MTTLCWFWLLAVVLRTSSQDSVEDVILMMSKVDPQSCSKLPVQLKILPRHSVIEYESGYTAPILDFQETLHEARKLVLNRAIFFSYTSQLIPIWTQPESSYYHLSVLSNLQIENKIQASGILFDKSKMTANWLCANCTLPRFGPYAYRISNDLYRLRGQDSGANNSDYLKESYILPKPWYNVWMLEPPVNPKGTQINVTVKHEDGSVSSKSFYGPPEQTPVKLSQPFYECDQVQQWIVSVTSPIVFIDTKDGNLAIPRIQYVAIATADVAYTDIDINPCPGNGSRNIFAGSARCKDTTICKPLGKFGVHRGSYECYCKLGYRYPDRQDGPYLGEEIENVTAPEYSNPNNFNCLKIIASQIADPSENKKMENPVSIDNNKNITDGVVQLVNRITSLSSSNCSNYAEKLDLGFSYKLVRTIKKQFISQARSALRLAHFLSSFLQNFNSTKTDVIGWNNRSLSADMMYGELIALLLSDNLIKVASISFEENILSEKRFFAASAMRSQHGDFSTEVNKSYIYDDLIINHYLSNYTSEIWYQRLKQKKQTPRLYDYSLDVDVRVDVTGKEVKKLGPLLYKAVHIDYASQASGPLYDCFTQSTLLSFDVPFFTKVSGNNAVKLGGFVSVGVDAQLIDINQCGDAEDELFRGTNLCDKASTKCVPIRNWGFRPGGYRCECNPGYEYPYNGSDDYFVGYIMENEYMKYLNNKENILNLLKCRKVNIQWTILPSEKLTFPARKLVNVEMSSIEEQKSIPGSAVVPSANVKINNCNHLTRISLIWVFVWTLFYKIVI